MSSLNLTQQSLGLAAGLARLQPKTDSISARVSSGQRIDRPSVDPAGLGQAAKLDAQQTRLGAVQVNLQNGISRMQVTSGQLGQINKILTRMGEITALASNNLQNANDKALYSAEFTQLQDQMRQSIGGSTAEIGGTFGIDAPTANFNGKALFGPASGESLSIGLQVDEQLALPTLNFRTGAIGDIIKQDASGAYTFTLNTPGVPAALNSALDQASSGAATIGAVQSRLEFASGVVTTAKTNQEAALSVIRDADLAKEVTALSRLQILSESHNAMLAQARDASGNILKLLSRG
ncbi:MAG: hypothetical protein RL376_1782 [Verrucomicrobiota bacterium]|jgi:flagellin